MALPRRVYVVLSARSLGYFKDCLESLFAHSLEPLALTLIPNTDPDVGPLREALESLSLGPGHSWRLVEPAEMTALEADRLAKYPNMRSFRHGHPGWRKLTDPQLVGGAGEEVVILDPDVYFPHRFAFEPTPETGFLLMWQRPNCLLPPEVVRRAFEAGIPLADHADIGVCHARAPFDLDWMEWLLGRLGAPSLPPILHIEPIVWSALGMKFGGGYLDPTAWVCFRKSIPKRLRVALGTTGVDVLRAESLAGAKCFHAGGVAKWWLADAIAAGVFNRNGAELREPTPIHPFRTYRRSKFERKVVVSRVARSVGFYKVFGEN